MGWWRLRRREKAPYTLGPTPAPPERTAPSLPTLGRIDRWLIRNAVPVDYWRWRSTDRWQPGRGPEW